MKNTFVSAILALCLAGCYSYEDYVEGVATCECAGLVPTIASSGKVWCMADDKTHLYPPSEIEDYRKKKGITECVK